MASTFSLCGIIFAVIFCFVFLYHLRNNKGLPKNWPVVGMMPELLLHVHRIYDKKVEILEQSHLTFLFKGLWFGNMDTVLTADPDNIHYIMSSNFSNFPKGSEFKQMFDILGDGIFNADFELWKNQRKVAQTLFNHRIFYQFLVKTTREKVEKGLVPVLEHVYEHGLVLDLQDLFQRFTFDATCMIVTGHDPNCLSPEFPEVAFSKAMDSAEEAIFYRHCIPESIWKLQRWLAIGEEKKLRKAWEVLDKVIGEIISAKKEDFRKSRSQSREEEQGVGLLTSYFREEHETGSELDDKFLRDVVINFMLAGRDTTSAALTWFFWLVSRNPQVKAKIIDELKSTLTETEHENFCLFDTERIKGLVYLHGALCESLRLYPPVPTQRKTPLKADTLPSGHHVNPQMRIMFSIYAMGRMKSIWGEDCLEFKPERWISERGGIKHVPSYKFLAFNAGPRTCLGRDVAFTQMKAVAATILHNYQIQVLDGQSVTPSMSLILHMKYGLKVRLTKRWA